MTLLKTTTLLPDVVCKIVSDMAQMSYLLLTIDCRYCGAERTQVLLVAWDEILKTTDGAEVENVVLVERECVVAVTRAPQCEHGERCACPWLRLWIEEILGRPHFKLADTDKTATLLAKNVKGQTLPQASSFFTVILY